MTYPHDKILRAWLDGKAIQYLPTGTGVWLDIEGCDVATKTPHLYVDGRAEYRIKPVTVRYRVALYTDGRKTWTETVNTIEQERNARTPERWITDWIEVDA